MTARGRGSLLAAPRGAALALALVAWMAPPASTAQEVLKLDLDHACAAEPVVLDEEIFHFDASEDAASMLKEIGSFSGLSVKRIRLRRSTVKNAVAYLDPVSRQRFILYDEEFIRGLKKESGSAWTGLAILAHEVAHHLNGHLDLADSTRRREEELEADKFVGHLLYKMKVGEDALVAVFENLGAGGNYPPRTARTLAARSGWDEAKRQAGDGAGTESRPPPPIEPGPQEELEARVTGLQLFVEHQDFVPHVGGLEGGPGLVLGLSGRLEAWKGASLQVVVRFTTPDGTLLWAHQQEPHYRRVGGELVTGSPRMTQRTDQLDLAEAIINPIPHWALNLIDTGYNRTYPILAIAEVYVDEELIAESMPVFFSVRW